MLAGPKRSRLEDLHANAYFLLVELAELES